jgi:diguanylate cyclase (GGDEF)-like protein
MKNRSVSKNKLSILVALLVLVLVAGAGGLVVVDQHILVLGLCLLGFVTVIAILRFNKWLDWIMLALCMAVYGWMQYSVQATLHTALLPFGVFAGVTLLAFLVSRSINHEVDYVLQQYSSSNVLIEELTLHDTLGLIKWHVFKQTLEEEFIRARRTKKSVSMLMIRLLNYQDYVSEGDNERAEELMAETAKISTGILRTLDKVSRYDQNTLGAILPETSQEEAKIAASRLINGIAQQAKAAVYTGITTFPDDAVTVDKMISRALAALEFALSSEKEQVSYAQLNLEDKEA